MTRADDLYMSGFNAALDAAEAAGARILAGTLPTLRREHAAAGLIHFVDAARKAMASNVAHGQHSTPANTAHAPYSEGRTVVITTATTVFAGAPKTDRATARAAGYTGDACNTCGSLSMKRVGSCLACDACGTTTDCS